MAQLDAGAFPAGPLPDTHASVTIHDPRFTLVVKPGEQPPFEALRSSVLFGFRSLAGLLGLDDLLHPLFSLEASPYCPGCGAGLESPDLAALLGRLDPAVKGVAAACVDVHTEGPGDLSAAAFLEMLGVSRLVKERGLAELDAAGAEGDLATLCSELPRDSLFGVLSTAALPLDAEARERFSRDVKRALDAGLRTVRLMLFVSRAAQAVDLGELRSEPYCAACGISVPRLTAAALAPQTSSSPGAAPPWRLRGLAAAEVADRTVLEAHAWAAQAARAAEGAAGEHWRELNRRLAVLAELGFACYRLGEDAADFSSGESLRARFALLLLSGLNDSVVVFDSVFPVFPREEGLRCLRLLKDLCGAGNTCLVVDSSGWSAAQSDLIMDDELAIQTPQPAAAVAAEWRDAEPGEAARLIRPGLLAALQGPSGGGKTTLLRELGEDLSVTARFAEIELLAGTPRAGGPIFAAAAGIYDAIAADFAAALGARLAGFEREDFLITRSRFRCRRCGGSGVVRSAPSAPDLRCPLCSGRRFEPQLLKVRLADRDLAQVLDTSVHEAVAFFGEFSDLHRKLEVLEAMGFGNELLGRPAASLTLSELQRLALAKRVMRARRARAGAGALYLLDQALLGLAAGEIRETLAVWRRLAHLGHAVVCADNSEQLTEGADLCIHSTLERPGMQRLLRIRVR